MIVHDEKTLFEKIGGMYAVDAAVEIFYAKVLADDRISHFFRWTHMKTQAAKQKAFLAYAFGAPLKYSGKNMRDAHANLLEMGLNDSHFDAVLEHLFSTLQDLDVSEDLILEVGKIAESTRKHVLGL
ncbi:MAG: group 1 truncated hemoglobin [Ferruginibacter sp.]|nr:group 1 truncated hemoglobin [Cytophagales bacterium]